MSSAVVPEPPPPPPGSAGTSFDFLKPLTFIFDDPRWIQKVLIGGLFVIASFFIIGAFFLYGYCARLARNVLAGLQIPFPEWDDLSAYFGERAKLVVDGLIYAVRLLAVFGVISVPVMSMSRSADQE